MSELEIVPVASTIIEVASTSQNAEAITADDDDILIDFSSASINVAEIPSTEPPLDVVLAPNLAGTVIHVLSSGLMSFEVEVIASAEQSGSTQLSLSVASFDQTVFTLLSAPTEPHRSQMFVNGIKATYGADYLIDNIVLYWLSWLKLEVTDRVQIIYR